MESPSFRQGESIPRKHSCEGADVSPALRWSDVPPGTKSFALICDDPDAPVGVWDHWVIYGIPGSKSELPEGVQKDKMLADGSRQGVNSWRRIGYGGPCPPPGRPHRYFFKLYAVKFELNLAAGADKRQVAKAIEGQVLGQAELMGTYGRG